MKFKDMPYIRPDMEQAKTEALALIEKLENALSFEEADSAFLQFEELTGRISTMSTLAQVRHSIDTKDEFYDGEVGFLDEAVPMLQEYFQMWIIALLESPYRSQFEKKYNELYFKNAEMELKTFSPEIIEELQRENALETEYMKLIAVAKIPFEGKIYTVAQMGPFKQDPDDKRRLEAWEAEAGFYSENGAEFDRIYDELVRLRDKMAKKLGYKGYTELGYYRMTRNSYTKEDIEKFRSAIIKYVVPLADRIYRRQAERLVVPFPLNFADMALSFRSGNPKPQGGADDILEHGRTFYHELSEETAEFIDFIYENELLDVLARTGKQGGGYCTEISDYKCPFIFANFNGTSSDVETVTHEAGHAFAFYTARDIIPAGSRFPTMESCEIHSMTMEFFAWPWAEGFFGKDTQKFYYNHLAEALKFLPYGTMVDHFQHIVYENPEMTPDERHDEWRKLLAIYMPWVKLGEIPFYGEAKGWQRQQHIYQTPFYYIDYCLAQTIALQFWAIMLEDRDSAWRSYLSLVRCAGTKTFSQLVESASLLTPFGDDALRTICGAADKWLNDFDITELK